MDERRKLSHSAYGGINGEEYIPFIPTSQAMPELSIYSIIMGAVFAMIFAAANTYLGLKVGLTIAAGIPGAILATGLLKGLFKRNNILEANMVASIAAVGESIAGGIIYILPAIILWGLELKISTIVVVTLLGGLVGIFFVTPLRKFLIVEEHGHLVYPESMAAAEVLVNGSEGGSGFKTVLLGLGIGGGYKLASGGFALWSERPEWVMKSYQGAVFGIDTLASLLGVGFIVGTEASLYMFGGAVVAWLGLIPLIKYIGTGLTEPLFPSTQLISEMGASDIWSQYIRYIGAGAVAAGGFISLGKSAPTIIKSFKSAMAGLGKKSGEKVTRINEEPPITWVIGAAILVFILSWILPQVNAGFIGSLMIVIFSFFFAVVSARMVGIIGASNNPVSGMTIATLLFVTAVLKLTGNIGQKGMVTAVLVAGVICVAIAVAGGTAQSLKTTFIIGGSPKQVQIGMYLGLVFGAVVAGAVLLMLNNTYGIGSESVPAPQATLMSMVIEGVMTGELPWVLVFIGVSIAVFAELSGLPVLPVALGLYLPIHLSAGILFGGIMRTLVERKFKNDENMMKAKVEKGILISSGLVAGDALMGIVVAGFATFGLDVAFGTKILPSITQSPIFATIIFVALGILIYTISCKEDK
ncbi:MAG: oligopeptide transporter, OPT family [Clostridium sp.]|uniref:OPT family oligopeptide transporter n=1 Tax=Clostridium culturomicium TaxID=1499683 RepID=UPI00058CF2EB|nr:oligopeptide transporter, OPT family [Clostridium culturomicium]MDU4890858.1 oligopeptide transporter, OPT family [Clostridium sp.]MDU7082180.1 oligopeptide transporter, OPT family [Clostridium sp.]